jgi:hypothetical protein
MIRLAACFALIAGQATADVRFENRAAAVPEHAYTGDWEHFVGGGVAVMDCNKDGLPDAYLAGGVAPAALWVNTSERGGAVSFASVASSAALTEVTGAYPLDIDGDGWLDLAVLRTGTNHLFKGGPDCSFSDAGPRWGFEGGERWSTSFSATWENDQDWPTLAIGNYVDRSNPRGPFGTCDTNEIYRPKGRGFGPEMDLSPGYCALSMLFSDWSRTGQRDLRISNDRHYYLRGGSEQMWRTTENRFLDEGDGWKHISIWGMGIASEDINGDGRPDVVLTSMGDQLLQFGVAGGTFEAAPFSVGTYAQRPFIGDDGRPSTGWHAEFGDVDNDGREDLFIAKGNVDQMPSNAIHDPNNLLMQGADGTFAETADTAGVATMQRSRGASLADFNGDGLLDLIVTNRRALAEVYQNVSTKTGHWLGVDLRQDGGNRQAVGAWVELRGADGKIRTREITVGGGHAGGKSVPLHFGLGQATKAEVRAIWPDGATSGWVLVPGGQVSTLTRRGDDLAAN